MCDNIEERLKKLTLSRNDKSIVDIQKYIRGFLLRKSIRKLNDGMTFTYLEKCIKNYKNTIIFETTFNDLLKSKKIRKTNFPSHISENLVKFAFYKKYRVMPNWDVKVGDLEIDIPFCRHIRLEVKGSIDLCNGPPTFGPCESWDRIYFVDAKDILNDRYKIYEFKIKNTDLKWKNLKVNKNETYEDQCIQGRRPRLTFNEILNQIGAENYTILFDGLLRDLGN